MQFIKEYIDSMEQLKLAIPILLGIIIIAGQIGAKIAHKFRMPSIIGMLLFGVLLGSSGIGIINEQALVALNFLSNLALGFVAINLGLELSLATIKGLGIGTIILILAESILTFLIIGLSIYLLSNDLVLALTAGAVGAASGPSGPVAVIQEYKARGKMTSRMFAVVGFDDVVGIIIFSFAKTFAVIMLKQEQGEAQNNNIFIDLFVLPISEILIALLIGTVLGLIYKLVSKKETNPVTLFIWLFGFMMLIQGLTEFFNYSLILANMTLGMVIVNNIASTKHQKILRVLGSYMPLIFLLFFVFAGSLLDVKQLPAIGIIGSLYFICRILGKFLGSFVGALIGRLSSDTKKYLWMGLLSQVGVGLGLSIILVNEYSQISSRGAELGATILTIVTATTLLYEVLAPWLTKLALVKVGEIDLKKLASDAEDEED